MSRYHRIEVLGALASVLSTWLVTGILLYEAVNRVMSPSPVNGKGMPSHGLLTICFCLCSCAGTTCQCMGSPVQVDLEYVLSLAI